MQRLLDIASADVAVTGALLKGADAPAVDRSGCEYGHFRLLECLGTGGMGAVYSAERTDGVPQAVAVKLLRGSISAEGRARFLGEAKFLARLEHPAIARLIDVGIGAADGEAWIAMELVRGVPITEYCDAHQLDLRARVRLLEVVIAAVAAAHRQLVVHRDIKPSNVLVSADGQPKLIDFGIAAAVSEVGDGDAGERSRLFTPHYAAPEQVRGEPVTVATDVFGLGALAYRLLAGVEPYREAHSAVAYMLAVSSGEACRWRAPRRWRAGRRSLRAACAATWMPSSRARWRATRRAATPPRRSCRRTSRATWRSAPVRARPATVGYRLGRFVRRRAAARRHRCAVRARARGRRGDVRAPAAPGGEAREAAARRGEFLEKLLTSADPREGRRDITVAELLDSAVAGLDQSLGGEPLIEASMLGLIAETNGSLGRYAQGLTASERQLALLEAQGAGALEIARALTARGELLRGWGHYQEAVPVLRRALALLLPLPDVAAERASALTELGMALANSSGEKEAEASFREAIALDRTPRRRAARRPGRGARQPRSTARQRGTLRRVARHGARGARRSCAPTLPPTHPDLMSMEQTYAMTLLNMKDPKDAEPIQREIIRAQHRGARAGAPRHPGRAGAARGDPDRPGRFPEAQALLRPTAVTLERVQGPENRYTVGAWSDYAIAACQGSAPEDGLAAAQKVAQIRARTLPPADYHQAAQPGRDRDVSGAPCTATPRQNRCCRRPPRRWLTARGEGFYTTQLGFKALRWLYEQTGRPADAQRLAARIKD